MKIHVNTGGLAQTNAYLLADEAAAKAAIIDAPDHTVAPLLALAQRNGWTVDYLLLTHGHFDHIADHRAVTTAFPKARVLVSRLEEKKLQQPDSLMFQLPFTIPPRKADAYLEDGQKVSVGGIELEVLLTPGHAEGHACLYSAREKILFAGDLLMAGSVGRFDLPDSDFDQLKSSLRRVLALPDDTKVYSGHGPATTIGREKSTNPYVAEWNLA